MRRRCYDSAMSDGFFFVLAGFAAAAMIALALVWPQGLGTRSPAPFGHPTDAEAPPAAAAQLKGAL
jgi:hypothetical protein